MRVGRRDIPGRRRRALGVAALLAGALAAGWWVAGRQPGLDVQLLDVGGFTAAGGWMPFDVTVGFTNRGRDLVSVQRIEVEPDFEAFAEAYNTGNTEIIPSLVLPPGTSASYRTRVALLNGSALPAGRRPLVFRIRVSTTGGDVVYALEGEFEQTAEPARRRFAPGQRSAW